MSATFAARPQPAGAVWRAAPGAAGGRRLVAAAARLAGAAGHGLGRLVNRLRRRWPAVRAWLLYYLRGLDRKTDELPVFVLASGLAFTMLLCIVPLTLIVAAVLGAAVAVPAIQHELGVLVRALVPYEPHADMLTAILWQRAQAMAQYRHLHGVVGVLGLLLVASGLFGTMRTILNQVDRVQRRRGAVRARLRDATMVLLMLCFLLVSVASIPFVEAFLDSAKAAQWLAPLRLGRFLGLLYTLASTALLLGAFLAVFFLLPDQRPQIRVAFVSAAWATLLWEAAAQGFGYYIGRSASVSRIYGAYALAAAVATWIYYASLVFVVAGLLGQLYRERRGIPGAAGGERPSAPRTAAGGPSATP